MIIFIICMIGLLIGSIILLVNLIKCHKFGKEIVKMFDNSSVIVDGKKGSISGIVW